MKHWESKCGIDGWMLRVGDADYPMRWSLIKTGFSRRILKDERRNPSRVAKGERGIWQRWFWKHVIRNEADYVRHVDYVQRVIASFHRYVQHGIYTVGCAGGEYEDLEMGER